MSFEGLAPGNRYKLFTSLMDKETGEAIEDAAGNPVVVETDFSPEAGDGTVEVELKLDTTQLKGKSLVFFEKLADAQDSVIATHEDLDDEGQTIQFSAPEAPESPTGKEYPKTGADAAKVAIAASAFVIVGCGTAGAAYAAAKRRKDAAKDAVESVEKAVEE